MTILVTGGAGFIGANFVLDRLAHGDETVINLDQLTYAGNLHDRRYAIDAGKLEHELGWRPRETFETGIRKTVEWYLANAAWVENVTSGAYRAWTDKQYKA